MANSMSLCFGFCFCHTADVIPEGNTSSSLTKNLSGGPISISIILLYGISLLSNPTQWRRYLLAFVIDFSNLYLSW
jgi:hypothetical protein